MWPACGANTLCPRVTIAALPDSGKDLEAGYLAEFDFVRERMRQDQRERQGFLGFTLAAAGLVLGLLMDADGERHR